MVNCPYCKRQMKTTGRTCNPGVEYECLNCKAVWNYVEKPDFRVLSSKNGILKDGSIFYPVFYPKVLEAILWQRPNKVQAKRIRKWVKSKQLFTVKQQKKTRKFKEKD